MRTLLRRLNDYDERMLHALLRLRRARMDALMQGVTHMGDAAVIVPLTLLLLLLPIPGARLVAYHSLLALAASHGAVQALKRTVLRARPSLPGGFAQLVACPDRFSFPSGHSAAVLSVALPFAIVLPGLLAASILAFALLAGISRCYLGVHYPADVVVGWLLGAAGAIGAVIWVG